MDMTRKKEKGKEHKNDTVPNAQKKERHKRKCNITKSLCRDERKCSVNDISNVRCHGWDMGSDKE